MWDGTRVDLLGEDYAWEVDWSHKWAEAIGQSLYYAEMTGRKPGVILLTRDKATDRRYLYRCKIVCTKFGIRLAIEDASVLI